MTPDQELELTLEMARSAREPGAADRRRVREALKRRIPLGPDSLALAREGSGVHAIPQRYRFWPIHFWLNRFELSQFKLDRFGLDRSRQSHSQAAFQSGMRWGPYVRERARRGRAALPQLVCISVAMGALGFWLGSKASSEAPPRALVHWPAASCR
jgi:hypothetical protein